MPRDGETAPRLGESFHKRARTLLTALGYIEKLDRRFGIDLVADPPSTRAALLEPSFSPHGRTAFEFKSGVRVEVPAEAVKLREKIDNLNTNVNSQCSDVAGGVIVIDSKAYDAHVQSALESHVYCWDISYVHLLAKKIDIFKTWLRLNRKPKEKKLDDWTTFFMNFTSYEKFIELRTNMFYHNLLQEMTPESVEEIIQKFSSKISRMTVDMNIPVITHLRLHSSAEVTEGAENKFLELTSQPVNEYIKFETQECFIASYKTAPWFIYCKENYL